MWLLSRDKMWLLSRVQRLAGPTWGTGAFCPGWSHQPGQKAPLFVPVVGSTRDKRSNPFIPGGNTNRDKRVTILSWLVLPTRTKAPFCPGSSTRDKSLERLLSRKPCPGSKIGTKASLEPGQKAKSVVVQAAAPATVKERDSIVRLNHKLSLLGSI